MYEQLVLNERRAVGQPGLRPASTPNYTNRLNYLKYKYRCFHRLRNFGRFDLVF